MFRHIYTLKEDEDWRLFNGKLIVVHPERAPKVIELVAPAKGSKPDLIAPTHEETE